MTPARSSCECQLMVLCDLCASIREKNAESDVACDECRANNPPPVELGATRHTIDELFDPPSPLSVVGAHRVTDGYSLELSDGRTLFVSHETLRD